MTIVAITLTDGRTGILYDVIHMKIYFGMLFVAFRTEYGDNLCMVVSADMVKFIEIVQF